MMALVGFIFVALLVYHWDDMKRATLRQKALNVIVMLVAAWFIVAVLMSFGHTSGIDPNTGQHM